MNLIYLTQQKQYKIVINQIHFQLIAFDELRFIIQMNNNFILPLLSQIYEIHLFRFQIKKIKNCKKRSDK